MIPIKVINFIYSRNKLDFKKFTKKTGFSDVVSYHDIITKLVKNDKHNERPSEIVINSYLRKRLIKSISSETSLNIAYAINRLDVNLIESVIRLILEYWDEEIKFNLIILEHKKLIIDEDALETIRELKFIDSILRYD